eukprot:893528_1
MPKKRKKRRNKRQKQLPKHKHIDIVDVPKIFDEIANDTALLILPPDDQIREIQKIRIQDDKWYERVNPHITLLWPFVAEKHFDNIVKYLKDTIESNNIQSFPIQLSTFDYFEDNDNELNEQY